jgi:hypothetical protein
MEVVMKKALLPTLLPALLVVGATALAACGSAAGPSGANTATPSMPAGGTPAPTTAVTATPGDALPQGEIRFRVVNLYRNESGAPVPVDVYVRTQGLVQAAPVTTALVYGEATDYFMPPDPGTVVVTTAGAGDPTCVASCPHFISESSTNFGEGDARTLILYADGTLDLWENPEPASVGVTGNALPPADPSTALVLVVGVALEDADFGLHLGFAGMEGCQVNRVSESILVGGNQITIFAFDGSADVLLYASDDYDCTGDQVGGPFTVRGEPGSRSLLVLSGSPGDMAALVLDL